MWGQVNNPSEYRYSDRIIPTRVGTSLYLHLAQNKQLYHPHACGDKFSCRCVIIEVAGSSPRVWGQVFSSTHFSVSGGIIPTRVGTSCPMRRLALVLQDHPHACGDKYIKNTNRQQSIGSSPRVWGQVANQGCGIGLGGIIPTRVGTSLCVFVNTKTC